MKPSKDRSRAVGGEWMNIFRKTLAGPQGGGHILAFHLHRYGGVMGRWWLLHDVGDVK